jgi:peroxiredoxin
LREFPVIEDVAEKFSKEQLVVLSINDDRSIKNIKKAVEKVKTSMPVLLDKGSTTVGAYKAFALPTLYLVDSQQKIHKVWSGSVKGMEDEVVEQIKLAMQP